MEFDPEIIKLGMLLAAANLLAAAAGLGVAYLAGVVEGLAAAAVLLILGPLMFQYLYLKRRT